MLPQDDATTQAPKPKAKGHGRKAAQDYGVGQPRYCTAKWQNHFGVPNPFDYLMAREQHAEKVTKAPSDWLPWNYRPTRRATSSG